MKQKAKDFSERWQLERRIHVIARVLVCCYFLNAAGTNLQIWFFYHQPFDYWTPFILIASLLVAFDIKTLQFGSVLALFAAFESSLTFYHQLLQFSYTGSLYINELMVKKLSLLGAILFILAEKLQRERHINPVAGLVLEAKRTMSTQKSLLMLIGRLFMSSLFLYVGINEVKIQFKFQFDEEFRNSYRGSTDGHNNMPAKLLEFMFCLPFIVGYRTNVVCRLLSLVLLYEAVSSWMWFLSTLHIGYVIHAREHFFVNLGVAGGVNMLSVVGAGKYTVDELLKKKE